VEADELPHPSFARMGSRHLIFNWLWRQDRVEKFGNWEVLSELGSGGQSDVFLVRSRERVEQRFRNLQEIGVALDESDKASLANSIYSYARPDRPDELGALKKFKVSLFDVVKPTLSGEPSQALQRLEREVGILRRGFSGLPRLLGSHIDEHWMVTELFPEGTLERHMDRFRGSVPNALSAFRSIVATVARLHEQKIVHRDIKPANVFVKGDELILGDFGIVYDPSHSDRPTMTAERVGPRDYMPPWADTGERLEEVTPAFDVYMLGKFLWCMLAGKMKLPREYHHRAGYDLEEIFPGADFRVVNEILDNCVVEHEFECLKNAGKLLEKVDLALQGYGRKGGIASKNGALALSCVVCGIGKYREASRNGQLQNSPHPIQIRLFTCDVCTNYQFFAPTYPEEAVKREFKPL
jgi:serine/threonine protein kinase